MRRVFHLLFTVILLTMAGNTANIAYAQMTDEASPHNQIDINSATATELMTLPGIGEERSAAILKKRPFKSPDELVTKKVMPPELYDIVKDRITTGKL